MNYPYNELLQSIVTAIGTATGLNVYTIAPQDSAMPYVFIENFTFDETGNKGHYMYEFDVTYNVMLKNPTSLKVAHDAIKAILSTANKVNGITVSGYTMIKNDVIGTSSQYQNTQGANYYSAIVRIKYLLT